jgi:O-antigen ligase
VIATEAGARRARAGRYFEALESFGLFVLLIGLPVSEAAKSAGIALAALGFLGRRLSGEPLPGWRRPAVLALAAYYLIAVVSVLVAEPSARRPEALGSLALTLSAFPLVLDACSRPERRIRFVAAILAGGAIAAVAGYVDYMSGSWLRLVLPSVENAVPAAEYLGALAAVALVLLFVVWRRPLVGPLVAFVVGVSWLALLMTKSRGPMVGAVVGAVAAVGAGVRRRYAVTLLVVLALGAVVFWRAHPEARVVGDLLVGSRAAASRVYTWGRTVERIAERPVLGHGHGSFKSLMIVYEDEIGPIHQGNAHNAPLHVLADTGLLGCGALAAFLVLGIRGAIRAARRAPPGVERSVSVAALGGVAAILAAGAFSVSVDAEPGILLYALLALGQPARR